MGTMEGKVYFYDLAMRFDDGLVGVFGWSYWR